jgi:hypothetical protein
VLPALLSQLTWSLPPSEPPLPQYLGLAGQYLALPLAALMAGYMLGYLGIGFCLGLTLVLLAVGNAVSLFVTQQGMWIEIEQPLFCLTFGYLGLRLKDAQTGIRRSWAWQRWFFYGLLVLTCLPALFSVDELINLVKPIALAFGAVFLAIAIEWLRRKLRLQHVTIDGEGWLKLLVALAVVAALAANVRSLFDSLFETADSFDLPVEIALPAILVVLHLPLAYLARVLMEVGPKIAGDLRSVATVWRGPPA